MKFDGLEYEVITELYRTKGSYAQILTENIPDHRIVESRRKFYIVEREGIKYFVKQYVEKGYGGGDLDYPQNIEYEFQTTRKLKGIVKTTDGEIDVPEVFARNDDSILFEFLHNYDKATLSQITRVAILVREWVKEKRIDNWDMCPNNVMVRKGAGFSLMAIDFEFSHDRHPMEDYNLK